MSSLPASDIFLSIVIPVHNEAENIPTLIHGLYAALDKVDKPAQVILVDDGSRDDTFSLLEAETREHPNLIVLRLTRNFGQTAALCAGLHIASGQVIVTADGDLQNDPADIPLLLAKLDEGFDVASGWRVNRQDSWPRRLVSRMANWLIGKVIPPPLHDYGCALKAYRARVIKEIRLYGDLHRFIVALAYIRGAKITEVPVHHHPRRKGASHYGMTRTYRVLLDLLLVKFLYSYGTAPLRFFGVLGAVTGGGGLLICLYLAFIRLVDHIPISDRPLLLLGVLLVVLGVQFICTGLLAEIQVRTYFEAQHRRTYVVREARNLPDDPDGS